jgi:hypothetical protein
MNLHRVLSPLLAGLLSSAALAADVAVREVQPGTYELVLTHPGPMGEDEARAHLAKTASSLCKDGTVSLGKWTLDANEAIAGAAASPAAPDSFRFVQEATCVAAAPAPAAERLPTLKSEQEAEAVRKMVKLKSESYFNLIASKRVDEALKHVDVTRMRLDEAKWKSSKLSFQATVGERRQILIAKITVYDNPANAPEPGLYVAADYSNVFAEAPIHCGYLLWFRPAGGDQVHPQRAVAGNQAPAALSCGLAACRRSPSWSQRDE